MIAGFIKLIFSLTTEALVILSALSSGVILIILGLIAALILGWNDYNWLLVVLGISALLNAFK
tara:strand:+ start:892 stop:1080 length:189 start_codon:yes stop_codon:yes gene_type:complete